MIMHNPIPIAPVVAQPMTELALCRWLGAAAPGDRITYHRGALARQVCSQLQCLPEPERTTLQRVAARARKLAEDGLADLVQRRHGFEDFEYLLIARRRPRRSAPNLLPQLLAEAA